MTIGPTLLLSSPKRFPESSLNSFLETVGGEDGGLIAGAEVGLLLGVLLLLPLFGLLLGCPPEATWPPGGIKRDLLSMYGEPEE